MMIKKLVVVSLLSLLISSCNSVDPAEAAPLTVIEKIMELKDAPIGVLNFNPGNLKPHRDYKKNPWLGSKRIRGGFVQFEHPMWGFRALIKTLKRNNLERKLTTPHLLVGRYLGHDANKMHRQKKNKTNRDVYLKQIEELVGFKPHQPVNFADEEQLFKFAKAMSIHEVGGQYYDLLSENDKWLKKGIEIDKE